MCSFALLCLSLAGPSAGRRRSSRHDALLAPARHRLLPEGARPSAAHLGSTVRETNLRDKPLINVSLPRSSQQAPRTAAARQADRRRKGINCALSQAALFVCHDGVILLSTERSAASAPSRGHVNPRGRRQTVSPHIRLSGRAFRSRRLASQLRGVVPAQAAFLLLTPSSPKAARRRCGRPPLALLPRHARPAGGATESSTK